MDIVAIRFCILLSKAWCLIDVIINELKQLLHSNTRSLLDACPLDKDSR